MRKKNENDYDVDNNGSILVLGGRQLWGTKRHFEFQKAPLSFVQRDKYIQFQRIFFISPPFPRLMVAATW